MNNVNGLPEAILKAPETAIIMEALKKDPMALERLRSALLGGRQEEAAAALRGLVEGTEAEAAVFALGSRLKNE